MNCAEITVSNMKEIYIKQEGGKKKIIIDGQEIDLSKIQSIHIGIDSYEVRLSAKIFDSEFRLPTIK